MIFSDDLYPTISTSILLSRLPKLKANGLCDMDLSCLKQLLNLSQVTQHQEDAVKVMHYLVPVTRTLQGLTLYSFQYKHQRTTNEEYSIGLSHRFYNDHIRRNNNYTEKYLKRYIYRNINKLLFHPADNLSTIPSKKVSSLLDKQVLIYQEQQKYLGWVSYFIINPDIKWTYRHPDILSITDIPYQEMRYDMLKYEAWSQILLKHDVDRLNMYLK